MPIIMPITDLRNHSDEILNLCKHENQPVFITKNGTGELVVMSQEKYNKIDLRIEL